MASWFAVQARDEAQEVRARSAKVRAQADQLRAQANNLRDEALNVRRHLYDAQMNRIQLTWNEDQPERIPQLLDAQRPAQTGGTDLRGLEWHFWSHRQRAELRTLNTRQGQVEFSDTNGLHAVFVASGQGIVWDTTTGKETCRFTLPTQPNKFSVQVIALSPDGRIVAAGGEYPANNRPKAVPNPNDFALHLWDAVTGVELQPLAGHTDRVTALAFSRAGQYLASASQDGTAKVWDLGAGRQLFSFAWPTFPALGAGTAGYVAAPQQAGPFLAAGLLVPSRNEWPDKKPTNGGVLAFEPGGPCLVWARDGRVTFWDLTTGTAVALIRVVTSAWHSVPTASKWPAGPAPESSCGTPKQGESWRCSRATAGASWVSHSALTGNDWQPLSFLRA